MANRPFQFRISHLLLAIGLVAAALAAIVPMIHEAREQAHLSGCSDHLKRIGLGLQNYHDTFECFPAAYQVDGSGQIAHSWRVAIWPFMMNDHRYPLYSYSEPWNGPNNSKLMTRLADVYRCPGDNTTKPGMTNYVAVVGPETMLPGTGYRGMTDVLTGSSDMIMVVETSNSDIHWMEPRDLPIEELEKWLDPAHKPTLLNAHTKNRIRGGLAVFADGHTEFLPQDIAIERLKSLVGITEGPHRSGNEPK